LTAVETSPLERFSIGLIFSRESCEALIASIPKMQVRTLEMDVFHDLIDMKRDVIQAVKRNASLRTVVAKMTHHAFRFEDWFDNEDKRKLASFSLRNGRLARWIENPTVMPKAAWPEALVVAQITGPDTVFCILASLPPSVWTIEGEQCRKRRRFDSPS
jgi:hypothetical protein